MASDCVRTEAEPLSNCSIREAVTSQINDFEFSLAQGRSRDATRHYSSREHAKVIRSSGESVENLTRVCCAQFAKRLDCRDACKPWRLCVIDMAHRDLDSDVRSAADRCKFHDRWTSSSCRRQAERCVRGNWPWHQNWSAPSSRFEQPMQPSGRQRLRVESGEPGECADLSPHVSHLPSYGLGCPKVIRPMARDGPKK